MKPLHLILALFACLLFSACNGIGENSHAAVSESQNIAEEQEPDNAIHDVTRERDFYKAVLNFRDNQAQYSPEYLEAVELPKALLRQDIACLQKCNASRLTLFSDGLTCGLNAEEVKAIKSQIKNLICLPLEAHLTKLEDRQTFITGAKAFDTKTSYLVYCFRPEGDLVFHVKGNQIVEAITRNGDE